jgi:hypothetical protein
MSSSKEIDLKRDSAAGVYLSEAPSPPMTPYSPPPYTLYTCVQYTYSHWEMGRVEPERRLKEQQFTKLGHRQHKHD